MDLSARQGQLETDVSVASANSRAAASRVQAEAAKAEAAALRLSLAKAQEAIARLTAQLEAATPLSDSSPGSASLGNYVGVTPLLSNGSFSVPRPVDVPTPSGTAPRPLIGFGPPVAPQGYLGAGSGAASLSTGQANARQQIPQPPLLPVSATLGSGRVLSDVGPQQATGGFLLPHGPGPGPSQLLAAGARVPTNYTLGLDLHLGQPGPSAGGERADAVAPAPSLGLGQWTIGGLPALGSGAPGTGSLAGTTALERYRNQRLVSPIQVPTVTFPGPGDDRPGQATAQQSSPTLVGIRPITQRPASAAATVSERAKRLDTTNDLDSSVVSGARAVVPSADTAGGAQEAAGKARPSTSNAKTRASRAGTLGTGYSDGKETTLPPSGKTAPKSSLAAYSTRVAPVGPSDAFGTGPLPGKKGQAGSKGSGGKAGQGLEGKLESYGAAYAPGAGSPSSPLPEVSPQRARLLAAQQAEQASDPRMAQAAQDAQWRTMNNIDLALRHWQVQQAAAGGVPTLVQSTGRAGQASAAAAAQVRQGQWTTGIGPTSYTPSPAYSYAPSPGYGPPSPSPSPLPTFTAPPALDYRTSLGHSGQGSGHAAAGIAVPGVGGALSPYISYTPAATPVPSASGVTLWSTRPVPGPAAVDGPTATRVEGATGKIGGTGQGTGSSAVGGGASAVRAARGASLSFASSSSSTGGLGLQPVGQHQPPYDSVNTTTVSAVRSYSVADSALSDVGSGSGSSSPRDYYLRPVGQPVAEPQVSGRGQLGSAQPADDRSAARTIRAESDPSQATPSVDQARDRQGGSTAAGSAALGPSRAGPVVVPAVPPSPQSGGRHAGVGSDQLQYSPRRGVILNDQPFKPSQPGQAVVVGPRKSSDAEGHGPGTVHKQAADTAHRPPHQPSKAVTGPSPVTTPSGVWAGLEVAYELYGGMGAGRKGQGSRPGSKPPSRPSSRPSSARQQAQDGHGHGAAGARRDDGAAASSSVQPVSLPSEAVVPGSGTADTSAARLAMYNTRAGPIKVLGPGAGSGNRPGSASDRSTVSQRTPVASPTVDLRPLFLPAAPPVPALSGPLPSIHLALQLIAPPQAARAPGPQSFVVPGAAHRAPGPTGDVDDDPAPEADQGPATADQTLHMAGGQTSIGATPARENVSRDVELRPSTVGRPSAPGSVTAASSVPASPIRDITAEGLLAKMRQAANSNLQEGPVA